MGRDAMINRTEAEWDALQDALGTLWGWMKEGHVIRAQDVADFTLIDKCQREDEESATDAYHAGLEEGLRQRGGDELVNAHRRVSEAEIKRATELAMRALATARADAYCDILEPFARAAEAVNPALSDDTLIELRLPEWENSRIYVLGLGSLREARRALRPAENDAGVSRITRQGKDTRDEPPPGATP